MTDLDRLSLRPSDCLAATDYVECEHPTIRSLAARLAPPEVPEKERARRLFRFVRDEIRYEFMAKITPAEYRATYVLEHGGGFCVQKAMLLCALGRAAGVPTALVLSDLVDRSLAPKVVSALGTNVMAHHGLNAFHLAGRWLLADASLTSEVVTRKGYRRVDFDGENDALLSATTLAGSDHAEYARFHGMYADLPFRQMVDAFAATYANADLEALARLGQSGADPRSLP